MKYVTLLRGINVGGRTIKMTELKAVFEKFGYQQVQTYLQSGNVEFVSSLGHEKIKTDIQSMLSETFHYPARVHVISFEKLKAIIAACPFDAFDQDFHAYVVFFEQSLEKQLIDEARPNKAIEQLQMGDGVIYWRVERGMTLKSAFAAYLTKAPYKDAHTNRNIRTLMKIVV